MDLQTAISTLDHENDDHWTANGVPQIMVLRELTGRKDLNRKEVQDTVPNFTRQGRTSEPEQETGGTESPPLTDTPPPAGQPDQVVPETALASELAPPTVTANPSPEPESVEEAEPIAIDPNALAHCDGITVKELLSGFDEVIDINLSVNQMLSMSYDDLAIWMEEIQVSLVELAKLQSGIRDALNLMTNRLNTVSQIKGNKQPTETFQDQIRHYHKSQMETNLAKAKTRQLINGLALDAVDKSSTGHGLSPIDLVLSTRKRQLPSKWVPPSKRGV